MQGEIENYLRKEYLKNPHKWHNSSEIAREINALKGTARISLKCMRKHRDVLSRPRNSTARDRHSWVYKWKK